MDYGSKNAGGATASILQKKLPPCAMLPSRLPPPKYVPAKTRTYQV